ncbi:MAG: hypothetical protein IMZ53_13035 [Thermoplasmata archaeon]|nr:hypothetical protein [Thermoplasmata archaeon]
MKRNKLIVYFSIILIFGIDLLYVLTERSNVKVIYKTVTNNAFFEFGVMALFPLGIVILGALFFEGAAFLEKHNIPCETETHPQFNHTK